MCETFPFPHEIPFEVRLALISACSKRMLRFRRQYLCSNCHMILDIQHHGALSCSHISCSGCHMLNGIHCKVCYGGIQPLIPVNEETLSFFDSFVASGVLSKDYAQILLDKFVHANNLSLEHYHKCFACNKMCVPSKYKFAKLEKISLCFNCYYSYVV